LAFFSGPHYLDKKPLFLNPLSQKSFHDFTYPLIIWRKRGCFGGVFGQKVQKKFLRDKYDALTVLFFQVIGRMEPLLTLHLWNPEKGPAEKVLTVNYAGTKDAWTRISEPIDTSFISVAHCSDGDITY